MTNVRNITPAVKKKLKQNFIQRVGLGTRCPKVDYDFSTLKKINVTNNELLNLYGGFII